MTTIFAKHVDLPFRLVSGVRYPQISGMGNTICSEQKEKYFIKYTDILSSGKNYQRLSDMQNIQDAIQDRCRSRRIQESGQVRCSTGHMQYSANQCCESTEQKNDLFKIRIRRFLRVPDPGKSSGSDPIILNMFLSVYIGLPKLLSVCGLPKLLSVYGLI